MAKILIGLSVLFLTLSAVFGVLNTNKARELRRGRGSEAHVEAAERASLREKEIKAREASRRRGQRQSAANESKVASAEAELVKAQTEKADLQAKLQAQQKRTRRSCRSASKRPARRKSFRIHCPCRARAICRRNSKTRAGSSIARSAKSNFSPRRSATPQDRSTTAEDAAQAQPAPAPRNPGVRGTVLAVNQAYNFVVLNLGGRQGVEANSEMLVLRRGAFIGKIRVSSVEPATAIGDIITNSLARGVQVQPGDIVDLCWHKFVILVASESINFVLFVVAAFALASCATKEQPQLVDPRRRNRNPPCLGTSRRNGRMTGQLGAMADQPRRRR